MSDTTLPRRLLDRIGSALASIGALLGKELRQLVRDRALFGYIIYTFTLHIVITASGSSSELKNAPILVRDADRSALSRELISELRAPYFRIEGPASDPRTAERALERGDIRFALDLPAGLAAGVERSGEPLRLQALVDSSKVTSGYLASSYATRINERLNQRLASARLTRAGVDPRSLPVIRNERRTLYNFTSDDRWTTALSTLLMNLTIACVLLPAAALVREKERGTAEQLLVTPLSALQILMPKVLAMVLVSLLGTATAVYAVMGPLFAFPCRGSAALFLSLTAVYAFTNAGLGVVLGCLARNMAQIGLLVMLCVLPLIELSGTWAAVESMPLLLREAMYLSPLRHFVLIAFGILLKGIGLDILWPHLLAIVAIGVVLFSFAALRFRRQFSAA